MADVSRREHPLCPLNTRTVNHSPDAANLHSGQSHKGEILINGTTSGNDMKKRGQSWSFDIALAVVIFILTTITFFAFSNSDNTRKLGAVQSEAHYILENVKAEYSPLQIVDNQEVNEVKLQQFASADYQELKEEAGVANDFCIYFEDEDGNVIPISGSNGIGSSTINVSNVPCKQN